MIHQPIPRPGPGDVWHLAECECAECTRPHPTSTPIAAEPDPSFVPLCMLAGVLLGNAIAFTVDAHGAWAALSAAIGSLLGVGR